MIHCNKSIFFIFISAILISIGFAQSQTEYIDVTESVVMAKHEYGANITCIATGEGLYFVDCGMSTELLSKFRTDMEKKFNKKSTALFITHAHIDHFLGMGAFKDVNVIAALSSRELWEKQLAIEFNEKAIEGYAKIFPKFRESIKTANPFLPATWFKQDTVLGAGDDKLIFTNTGGHTTGSSSVYFPKEGVLVTGDLVQVDKHPYFGDQTNDMNKWLETFRKWEALPLQKVCPGHGRVVGKAYITVMRNYFESLIVSLKKLKEQNLPIREVIRHKDLPEGYWTEEERPQWFDYCIASLYQSIYTNAQK